MPPSEHFRPAQEHARLGDAFFDRVQAAQFPEHTLRFRNQRWADRVGLGALTPQEWTAHFGEFEALPGSLPEPLALRYHGHQFRMYNPQLGDGRGFLFAQLYEGEGGRLLDLGTKGSGQTPWSRGGDGRLTLKGGVREVLATEMLEALGVDTSKTFSVIETGESLYRGDEPSPTRSCVLVRLSHGHIRFGSFQRLAFRGEESALRELIDYAVPRYLPEADGAEDAPTALLAAVCERSARLCAQWMAAGFVHGVLNTDNMNITGESFDYGPFRFLPRFEPGFTAAYFDHSGLYAYGRQPDAVLWNLERLAAALEPVGDRARLEATLEDYVVRFERHFDAALLARLGLRSAGAEADAAVRVALIDFLRDSQIPFEQCLFDWYGGELSATRAGEGYGAAHYDGPFFVAFRAALEGFEAASPERLEHPYFQAPGPCGMLIDEVEAIWAPIAERDDWRLFEQKIQAIRSMGEAYGA